MTLNFDEHLIKCIFILFIKKRFIILHKKLPITMITKSKKSHLNELASQLTKYNDADDIRLTFCCIYICKIYFRIYAKRNEKCEKIYIYRKIIKVNFYIEFYAR